MTIRPFGCTKIILLDRGEKVCIFSHQKNGGIFRHARILWVNLQPDLCSCHVWNGTQFHFALCNEVGSLFLYITHCTFNHCDLAPAFKKAEISCAYHPIEMISLPSLWGLTRGPKPRPRSLSRIAGAFTFSRVDSEACRINEQSRRGDDRKYQRKCARNEI